jgi:hypothetical protein
MILKKNDNQKCFRMLLVILFLAGIFSRTLGIDLPDVNVSDSTKNTRLRNFIGLESALYVGTLYGLSSAWYGSKTEAFHLFNDNSEWFQIDKVGHFYSAYNLCRVSNQGFLWTGISKKRAATYGAISGAMYMTTIEILDGFQSDYGFSLGDMTANVVGPGMYLGQELLWGETRIQPKWSVHQTGYATLFPKQLGKTWQDQWLKDYNGQTYWLSGNVYKFLKKDSKFPKWLNVSLGYGIQNMVNADAERSKSVGFVPFRQYYLSLDVDLGSIKTKSKVLKSILFFLNQVKIPAPTLEYNSVQGFQFHGIYF